MKIKFDNKDECLALLHAVENEIHSLNWRSLQSIEPGDVWAEQKKLLQKSLRAECDLLKEMKKEIVSIYQSEFNT